ncbi:PREDICTED: uncharacterized protein LOC106747439 isoform X2 [Dinoponera quadriceps]|nr:PREDICTED: uncharacterized protein LOC106747439 isoform X2 [Dinoponera quadriceps]
MTAYNSMSQHLRRILSAKSVVDSRNKSYICRKNKRSKPTNNRRICPLPKMTDDIINRLAYDTQHHPLDILRMKKSPECLGCCDCNLEYRRLRNCGRPCCKASGQTSRQRSTSRSQRSVSPAATSKRKKFIPNTVSGKELKSEWKEDPGGATGSLIGFARQRKYRYKADSVFVPCTTTTLDPSEFKSTCCSPIQETNDRRLESSRTLRSPDDSDDKSVDRSASQKEDEKKYVDFIYDITKEIMQSGLYTDKELQDVFKKHTDKNKGILNMNRMLFEIYQLKISLNMLDEESDDVDDELEDLIHAQKLLHVSEIRPPTPPKVLDENKVMEKFEYYQKSLEAQDREPSRTSTKTVVVVDANPEMLLTEGDVLISLIEAGIDPKQAQYICKSLFYKSKDPPFDGMVPVKAEASPLQPASLEPRDDNRRTSFIAATSESVGYSVEDNLVRHTIKQKARSSVWSFVATQDETVETKKDIDKAKDEAEASYSYSEFEKSEESQDDDKRTSLIGETSASNLVSTQDETIETEEGTESQTASDSPIIKPYSIAVVRILSSHSSIRCCDNNE